MAENDLEKTEQPTPRRLEESRRDGNVARSTDLTAACILLASVLLLYVAGEQLLGGMKRVVERMLGYDGVSNPTRWDHLPADASFAGQIMLESMGPMLLGIVLAALAASIGQVGFLFSVKPLQPTFSRMSPARGLKNLIGIRAGVRLMMALAKIIVILGVAGVVIARDFPRIIILAELETMPMFAAASGLVFSLGVKLALVLIVLAIFDFAFQRMQRIKDLRMTKEEVKEELKRMEGDPLTRQRRSRIARHLALQRIAQAVPNADVVVTNPTHFAVALKYESKTMKAPKVTAKGADHLAQRIRQLAMAHGIPMVERKELAQAIYRTVEVGQEVPPQYYSAVAEILAFVYRLSHRRSA